MRKVNSVKSTLVVMSLKLHTRSFESLKLLSTSCNRASLEYRAYEKNSPPVSCLRNMGPLKGSAE